MAAEAKHAAPVPAWKTFTAERLAAIEEDRKAAQAKGPIVRDPKGTYGKVCRACTKPNALDVSFCTGCSFSTSEWDVQRLPDNVFLELIKGKEKEHGVKVHFRDADVLVFDDKFGVSDHCHVDVIPVEELPDISVLTRAHVPLLELLYRRGRDVIAGLKLPWLRDDEIDEFVVAGYNYPVSVKHLHLHMIMPTYKHHKILQYPRWHSHQKVINDLKKHDKVIFYEKEPNDAEGKAVYDRAMENERKAKERIAKLKQKAE